MNPASSTFPPAPPPIFPEHEVLPKQLEGKPGILASIQCEIITDFARLEELAVPWERLWQSDPKSEIFQRFNWVQAWWTAFGDGFKLCVPVVYQADEVALILPLVERGGTLQFLGSPQADYSDILCSDRRPAELLSIAFDALLRSAPEWKECILEDLRPDGHVARAAAELPQEIRCLLRLEVTDCRPGIQLGEKRNQVIESLLAGKHMRRRVQKLQRAGLVSFRHIEDREEAQQQLTSFFLCHQRRCALLEKVSCFEEPKMRAMMRTLVSQLNLRQELRFGALELNGQALAWSLGFQVHGKYAYYQQTFDVDAEEYSPGDVLLHHLLLYAKETVEREFDFLRGDEVFKRRFATHINHAQRLYLERPGIRGRLRYYGRSVQGHFARCQGRIEGFARTHETLFRMLRSVAIWKRGALRRFRLARRTREMTRYFIGSGLALFKESLRTERLSALFQMEKVKELEWPECPASDPGISITHGRLSDFADLAQDHPEISFLILRTCRRRLKGGDQAYLVRQNGEVALLAWAGIRPAGQLSQVTSPSFRAAPGAAVVLYECWAFHDSGGVAWAHLLALLRADASKWKLDLLIRCPFVPPVFRVELERLGLFSKFRIAGHRIIHWLGYDGIGRTAVDEQQSSEDHSSPKLRNAQEYDTDSCLAKER